MKTACASDATRTKHSQEKKNKNRFDASATSCAHAYAFQRSFDGLGLTALSLVPKVEKPASGNELDSEAGSEP